MVMVDMIVMLLTDDGVYCDDNDDNDGDIDSGRDGDSAIVGVLPQWW